MICNTCKNERQLSEFYFVANRFEKKCKDCKKEYMRLLRKEKSLDISYVIKERQRAKDKWERLYKSTGTRPVPNKTIKYLKDKKYRENNREKKSARDAVYRKKLKSINGELHHWSYKKEHRLDVIDIPKYLHSLVHTCIIYDKSNMMYRRIDTNELLDTKDKHSAYVEYLAKRKDA